MPAVRSREGAAEGRGAHVREHVVVGLDERVVRGSQLDAQLVGELVGAGVEVFARRRWLLEALGGGHGGAHEVLERRPNAGELFAWEGVGELREFVGDVFDEINDVVKGLREVQQLTALGAGNSRSGEGVLDLVSDAVAFAFEPDDLRDR